MQALTSKEYVDNNFLEAQTNASRDSFIVQKNVTFTESVFVNGPAVFVNGVSFNGEVKDQNNKEIKGFATISERGNDVYFTGSKVDVSGQLYMHSTIFDKNGEEVKALKYIAEDEYGSKEWLSLGVGANSTFVEGPLYGKLYDTDATPYLAPKHIQDTARGALVTTESSGMDRGALLIQEGGDKLKLMANTGNVTQDAPTVGAYRNTLMMYPGQNGDVTFVVNNGIETQSTSISFNNIYRLDSILQGLGIAPRTFSTERMLDKHVYKLAVPESGADLSGLQIDNNTTAELWLDIPVFTAGTTNIVWPSIYWVDGTSSTDGDHDIPVAITEPGRYHYVLRKEDGLIVCNMSYRTSIPTV